MMIIMIMLMIREVMGKENLEALPVDNNDDCNDNDDYDNNDDVNDDNADDGNDQGSDGRGKC